MKKMSYDLNFWKYKKGVYLNNQEVYTKCCEGEETIEGLEDLPMKAIIQDVKEEFADWHIEESPFDISCENLKGEGAFIMDTTTNQCVRFDCTYSMSGEDMNRIIDVMLRYDCPLYDPQVPKRFD